MGRMEKKRDLAPLLVMKMEDSLRLVHDASWKSMETTEQVNERELSFWTLLFVADAVPATASRRRAPTTNSPHASQPKSSSGNWLSVAQIRMLQGRHMTYTARLTRWLSVAQIGLLQGRRMTYIAQLTQ